MRLNFAGLSPADWRQRVETMAPWRSARTLQIKAVQAAWAAAGQVGALRPGLPSAHEML